MKFEEQVDGVKLDRMATDKQIPTVPLFNHPAEMPITAVFGQVMYVIPDTAVFARWALTPTLWFWFQWHLD